MRIRRRYSQHAADDATPNAHGGELQRVIPVGSSSTWSACDRFVKAYLERSLHSHASAIIFRLPFLMTGPAPSDSSVANEMLPGQTRQPVFRIARTLRQFRDEPSSRRLVHASKMSSIRRVRKRPT
jgi:hypothetical protein